MKGGAQLERMNKELKCVVCGKLASDDCNFDAKQMICNKHRIQLQRHGKFLDDLPSYKKKSCRICCVCGDSQHNKYGFCNIEGEYYGKEMCGKHLNQMRRKGKIIDYTPSKHRPQLLWTDEEVQTLIEGYAQGIPLDKIASKINRSVSAISAKAQTLRLPDLYVSKFNVKYDAPYKDFDWLKERYIDRLMTPEEIAVECNASARVISKWCERFGLYQTKAKRLTHINDKQKALIMFSLLGDGHIDKREDRPLFIVSHAISQKDYLFWKYEILKNLCNKEPTFYDRKIKTFNGKEYMSQESYRLSTRILDALLDIRSMSKSEIIQQLNEFGLAIHFLDDASRSCGGWELCYAAFTEEERKLYCDILERRFNIKPRMRKDCRYIGFGREDSLRIDEIILRNIPNNLDIIKNKILKDDDDGELCCVSCS